MFHRSSDILSDIKNGKEEVLVYLTKKFFPSARKFLRLKGLNDAGTPIVFSHVLAKSVVSIQRRKNISHIDFEKYLFESLAEEVKKIKEEKPDLKNEQLKVFSNERIKVVSDCVLILDEYARTILFARFSERLSYEKIAERFQFSNAVIAQHEVNKALNQLEGIVKLRLNISSN